MGTGSVPVLADGVEFKNIVQTFAFLPRSETLAASLQRISLTAATASHKLRENFFTEGFTFRQIARSR